jgi:tetratricopeptide (TPR) repeat protein
LVGLAELAEILVGMEPDDAEAHYMKAGMYYGLGDFVAADAWLDHALAVSQKVGLDIMLPDLLLAARHFDRQEDASALAIARSISEPGAPSNIMSRSLALRMRLASDMADGLEQEAIDRYLQLYPELAESKLPRLTAYYGDVGAMDIFSASLDLASIYLQVGQLERGTAILAMVEEQLPQWPKISWLGYNTTDADLHAIRGENEKALEALRNPIGTGSGIWWRWQLMHNPHLSSIRQMPEFAQVVADYESRMTAQLATVRQLERSGKITRLPTDL